MMCQILFPEKNISKCCLPKISPRVLSVEYDNNIITKSSFTFVTCTFRICIFLYIYMIWKNLQTPTFTMHAMYPTLTKFNNIH